MTARQITAFTKYIYDDFIFLLNKKCIMGEKSILTHIRAVVHQKKSNLTLFRSFMKDLNGNITQMTKIDDSDPTISPFSASLSFNF